MTDIFSSIPLFLTFIFFAFTIVIALNWILPILFGYSQPRIQLIQELRHQFKRLRRIKIKSTEIKVIDGYMYEEVTYTDDSTLLFR